MKMKITRDYILGLGSGLVVSALIMFVIQWSGFGVGSDINRETTGQDISAQKQIVESETNANDDSAPSQEIRFTVPYGADTGSIANLLVKKGIITDKQAFIDAAGRLNVANKLQTGTFTFQKGLSVYEIIDILIQKPK
jgi:hypothetical protein